jgi:DNA processing protein
MTISTSAEVVGFAGLVEPRFELSIADASFPAVLLKGADLPDCLYGIGQEAALRPGVAIIGARNATPYGRRVARLLAEWAVSLDLVVYSGCARGCDQAAHQAALEAGGTTVAVMGCGADVAYPKGAVKLLKDIAHTGAIVSAYPWGTPPRKFRFRERNRLIAALSCLLVVTEARLPSGTLSAVQHALDLGVAVAAVPGSIFCLESAAPNKLISEGALPICCREDFLLACGIEAETWVTDPLFVLEEEGESGGGMVIGSTAASPSGAAICNGNPVAQRIMQAVQAAPLTQDELAVELELESLVVADVLGRLEVAGKVGRFPGGRYGALC